MRSSILVLFLFTTALAGDDWRNSHLARAEGVARKYPGLKVLHLVPDCSNADDKDVSIAYAEYEDGTLGIYQAHDEAKDDRWITIKKYDLESLSTTIKSCMLRGK